VPGAADQILFTLDAFGFEWDGAVLYQSTRTAAYEEAIARLCACGLVYPCACSRSEIAASARAGSEGPVYPGICRPGLPAGREPRSLRLRTPARPLEVRDRVQGLVRQSLERDVGDFIVRRADGIHAYQLAVVVDDSFQGIDRVVRGADLLLSAPRQVFLLRSLGEPIPTYAHLPLAVDGANQKLSKADAAAPVDPADPLPSLLAAWCFLGQEGFPEHPACLSEFWGHALAHWDMGKVPPLMKVQVPERRPTDDGYKKLASTSSRMRPSA